MGSGSRVLGPTKGPGSQVHFPDMRLFKCSLQLQLISNHGFLINPSDILADPTVVIRIIAIAKAKVILLIILLKDFYSITTYCIIIFFLTFLLIDSH